MYKVGSSSRGFTIVELLIVIVIIGVLAALVIIAFNGMQERAQLSSITSDLHTGSKKILLGKADTDKPPATTAVLPGGSSALSFSSNIYNIVTYCASDTDFVLAAESKTGKKLYTKNNATVVRDDTINAYNPCVSLSVSSANKVFMGMSSTSCAAEGGSCAFSGTKTIAYGRLADGRFNALANQSSPVQCTNAVFGDPAVGSSKACYVVNP